MALSWLSQSEGVVVPRATHFVPMENPGDMAEALANFWERHAIVT